VFTPFVVVVGGKYFLPTLECQFLNLSCTNFFLAIKRQVVQGRISANGKPLAFVF
jgi:hypothetical protein